MAHPSRTQLAAYVAVAIAALLLGARWIRASDAPAADASEPAATPADAPGIKIRGEGGKAVVHVAGEVRKPGIYRLAAGARVADAVKRAGGATAAGSTDAINLAARITDGQQIIVPGRAPGGGGANGAASAAGAGADGPISLGTATVEQLDTIEGIGPVTAQEIIAFRDRNGGLSSIEQLDEIHGIGPATMEALRERLQP